jgi:hypothetical protein
MKTKYFWIVACLLSMGRVSLSATFYADASLGSNCVAGNYSIAGRNCNGSDGVAYTTIQAAVNAAMLPGDFVYVRAGTYVETVVTVAAGSSAKYITIKGYSGETPLVSSTASKVGFKINKNYVWLEGFEIAGLDGFNALVYIASGGASTTGNYAVVKNNYIHDATGPFSHGIYIHGGNGSSLTAAINCTLDGNTISRTLASPIWVGGSGHTIIHNVISGFNDAVGRNKNDPDAVWILGHDITVRSNEFKNFDGACPDGCGSPCRPGCSTNHTDIFQTGGDCGAECPSSYNIVIERNYVHDANAQISQLIAYTGAGSTPNAAFRDWTFRNNIFARVAMKLNSYLPNTRIYNNTFYHVEDPAYGGVQSQNPVWIQKSAGVSGIGDGTGFINNNIFFGCSEGVSTRGWYESRQGAPITAAYNFVASGNYAAKTGFNEARGINGGDPKFLDDANNDYRLSSDSPIIAAGSNLYGYFTDDYAGNRRQPANPWAIGAYTILPDPPTNLRILNAP